MTQFDPAVAYRILSEKMRRLNNEAVQFLRQRIEREIDGHRWDKEFYRLDDLHKAKSKEADDMMDIVLWLQDEYMKEDA